MKTFAFMLVLLLGLNLPAFADGKVQTSRSVGKLKQDEGTDLSQLLEQREAVSRAQTAESENYTASAAVQKFAGVANRHDQLFEIYDADVHTISDFDGDGYHHKINVYFDVDVSYDSATVYAKLYLSREGGPGASTSRPTCFPFISMMTATHTKCRPNSSRVMTRVTTRCWWKYTASSTLTW